MNEEKAENDREENTNENTVLYSDLHICTFLLAKKHKLQRVVSVENNKKGFVFLDDNRLREDIDDYFLGKAVVDPSEYKNAWQNLKTIIHQKD